MAVTGQEVVFWTRTKIMVVDPLSITILTFFSTVSFAVGEI